MQTIFKYNSPPFEFWNGVNGIVITESDHNSGWIQQYNLRGRQGYDWNIVLDEHNREKRIIMKGYIKGTSAQDMLDKLNIFKQNIMKRGNYISSTFPLISQELPFLEIQEWTWNVKYEGFFDGLDQLTTKTNWMINFLPLNLTFICPNGYWIGAVRSLNVALSSNYSENTNIMFPVNNSNTIIQPGITLFFNANFNGNITLQIWEDTMVVNTNMLTWQAIRISTVSNIIGVNKYNVDTSFNSELDFSGVVPRGIRLWGTQFSISFSTSINSDMNVIFQERFI